MVSTPDLDHKVRGSNLTGGEIHLMTVQHFIAQTLLLTPFHYLESSNAERDIKHYYHHLHEETQSNRASDFCDFLCSLFSKAILLTVLFFSLSHTKNANLLSCHTNVERRTILFLFG